MAQIIRLLTQKKLIIMVKCQELYSRILTNHQAKRCQMAPEEENLKRNGSTTLEEITGARKIPFKPTELNILILGIALSFSIFLFDMFLRIGFVASMLYLIPVMICIWSPKRRTIFLLAGLSSILTLVAVPLKPSGDILIPLLNRPLSLLALWTMVLLIDLFISGLMKLDKGLKENSEIARQRAEEIELLMNITPAAIWVSLDPECRVITGNQMADIFYESREKDNVSAGSASGGELNQTRRFFRDGRELRPEELPMQEAARLGTEVRDSELEVLLPSGSKISMLGNAKPLLDKEGKVRGSIASFIDITERKKSEKALQSSRRTLADIIDFLPDATFVVDLEGKVIAWNQAIERMTGVRKEDMIDQGGHACSVPFYGIRRGQLLDLLTLDDEELKEKYDFVTRRGDTLYAETFCNALNGGNGAHVWATATSIFDDRGNRFGAIESIRDITERKKAENELRRSNIELQQFAYIASHDLQEPLRMVINYLSLLESRCKDQLDPEAEQYINFAMEGGSRMRELIDDLLGYSRVDSTSKEFTQVNMEDVVSKALTLLKIPIEESKAEVIVDPLPSIDADESQMIQLMQNLVGNSIKFRGPDRPMIRISSPQGTKEWTFAVKDNGIGLNVKYAEKIFQIFQRLNTRDVYPGTGVGLAVSKKIVEHHMGKIWVESEEGKGATFFFTIPISKLEVSGRK